MLLVVICHVLSCPSLSCGLCQFQLRTGFTFVLCECSNEHGQFKSVVLVPVSRDILVSMMIYVSWACLLVILVMLFTF